MSYIQSYCKFSTLGKNFHSIHTYRNYIGWDQFNIEKLIKAEKTLLGKVQANLKCRHISIDPWKLIYTISLSEEKFPSKVPFVLLHGFGAGVGIWAANLEELAKGRPVHAIDLLGKL